MNSSIGKKILVVGAGLAGSECAMFLARHGLQVVLLESKRQNPNPAQKSPECAELVCTNSLKSMRIVSGHGLLKAEMKDLGSRILETAEETCVPAGEALAVDRDLFSKKVTEKLSHHENISLVFEEVIDLFETQKKYLCDYVVLASGPLTTPALTDWIRKTISSEDFYFYDAVAPVVDADSLDMTKLYFKDRRSTETSDYLNAPMDQKLYEQFVHELVSAEKTPTRNFEDYQFFEGCLPVDIMAERGLDTLRYSCMKPLGLEFPDGRVAYAVIQLRKENLPGSAYNLVGFQTRLTHKEQIRVFRMIPGLENAKFLHLGSVHRNSFIHSRKLLNADLSSKKFPQVYFAGQITGVEGYTESAAMGQYVAIQILAKLRGCQEPLLFPIETAIGALVNYLMTTEKPIPSNINFGLLPLITLSATQRKVKDKKKLRKELVSTTARKAFSEFLEKNVKGFIL